MYKKLRVVVIKNHFTSSLDLFNVSFICQNIGFGRAQCATTKVDDARYKGGAILESPLL